MKRILTSALALVLFIGAAKAQSQNKQKHSDKKEHRQNALKGIDLTAEQQTQVKTINKNYRAQLDGLKTQNLTAEQLKSKRDALRQQHSSELRTVLTAEQKAKLQSSRAEKKDGARSHARIERKGKGTDKEQAREKRQGHNKELNLTADQKAKMKALNQSYKAKFEALRNDGTQSKEAKKAKLDGLKKERQESVKAILTAEQQAKMQEYRKRPKVVTK